MRVLAILLFSVLSMSAQGQTTTAPKVKFQVSLGGNYSLGNSSVIGVSSTNNQISSEAGKWEWNVAPSFLYTETRKDGEYTTQQRETYVVANVARKFNTQKSITLVEAENSYMKKILLRTSIGTGWSWSILRNERCTILFSEMAMYENYQSEVFINKNLQSLRLSSRIKFELKKPFKFTSITFLQPSVWTDRGVSLKDNFSFRSQNTLEIPVSKKFTVGLNANVVGSYFSNYVNPNVKPVDVITSVSLVYKNF